MIPEIYSIMKILALGSLIFLCFKFHYDKKKSERNGKIEIKFTKSDAEETTNTVRFTDLILEIKYRLIRRSKYNKEESAVLISDLVRHQCEGFKIGYSTQKTLEEIANIIEKIKPLLSHKTGSELTDVNYRISQETLPYWPKEILSES